MYTSKPSISIVVPAYNEEGNLANTISEIVSGLGDRFSEYEIIVVNDGSTDKTVNVIQELCLRNPSIKVLTNPRNGGFGYSYLRGMKSAICDYVAFFPGDNAFSAESIDRLFSHIGEADIISHYTCNAEVRLWVRRVISTTYTVLMNTLFGLNLIYYNGVTIHRRNVIQSVEISSGGFGFLAEIWVRLIRSGQSYQQIATPIREQPGRKTKAFKLKNALSVGKTICKLFWDVRIANRKQYTRPGFRVAEHPSK